MRPHAGRSASGQDRVFRLLLRLLPGDFRTAYARDMEATFRAQRRAAGGIVALAALWLATAASVLSASAIEHGDLLARDVRFAVRSMARRPWLSLTAVLTLALGLGASVALFSVADAVLLAPLPYQDPDRLVVVSELDAAGEASRIGYRTFLDLRERAHRLTGLVAAGNSSATLAGDGRDAERVNAMRVSAGYFELLGLRPELGRSFEASEDRPGSVRHVAVLSDGLWRRRYGADPDLVGRVITVGGTPYAVVGVLPALRDDLVAQRRFGNAEFYVPLGYDPEASFACRSCRHLEVLGRLARGATPESAQRELSAVLAGLAQEHPTDYDAPSARVTRLADLLLGPTRPVLAVLAGGVALLLLAACVNVSNLLLLRARERAREICVRTALGVSPARLARQLVTESLLLALVSGAAGLLPAWGALRILSSIGPEQLPRLGAAALDARALVVGLALVAASTLAFGLVPLLQLLRGDPSEALLGAGRPTHTAGGWRLRATLVAANVTVAAILLVAAGLLTRSLSGLLAVAPGFDAAQVLTARVVLSGDAYRSDDEAANIAAAVRFFASVLERARALPGVEAAAAVTTLPLGGGVDGYGIHVAGRPLANPAQAPSADRFVVTPQFFETLRIPLLRGRLLEAGDAQGTPAVVVVNRRLAAEMFPGEDALGHELSLGPPGAQRRRIVGIVEDVRHHGLDVPAGYQVYVPQAHWAWAETQMTLLLRCAGDPLEHAAALREIVRGVDPAQPLGQPRRYDDVVAATTGTRRFATLLLGLFAAAALALALVGVYGVLGVVVSQRRREIGVRLALGARGSTIRRMVLVQGMWPVAAGLCAGLLLAGLATRALRSLLYGVEALDPHSFAAAAALLFVCAALACLLPARHAARIDPATTLRAE